MANTIGDLEGQVFIEDCEPQEEALAEVEFVQREYNVKFEALDLIRFRGHQQLHLGLKPVTVLYGPNGSGKSSVRDAIEWLSCGRCPCTNERGQGPVGFDGQEPTVTATIPGGGTITRSGNRLACSWAPKSKKPELALAEYLGCDPDRARLAMQAGRFFRLDSKDRKALLWDLLDLYCTPGQVEEYLKEQKAPLDRAVSLVGRSGLGQLDLVHDKAYARRREVNRKVDELKKHLKLAEEEQSSADGIWMSEEDIQVLLDEDKALQAEDRQLVADEQKSDHELAIMKRELSVMEAQAEQQRFCNECGAPTAAQSLAETTGGTLREAIAQGEAALPAYRERMRTEADRIAAKRNEIQDKLRTVRGQRESMSTLNASREALKRHQQEVLELNLLLDYFGDGPGGIMHGVIRPKIEKFEAELNQIGQPWGLKIRYTSALTVEACQYQTAWVAYEGLSDGQQLLVSFCHQVAFARKFGLGLVCLDRIEALDSANQHRLFEVCGTLVAEADSGVSQCLLFGVHPVAPFPDKPDWFYAHQLEDYVINWVGF